VGLCSESMWCRITIGRSRLQSAAAVANKFEVKVIYRLQGVSTRGPGAAEWLTASDRSTLYRANTRAAGLTSDFHLLVRPLAGTRG